MKAILAICASILAIVGNIPYIRDAFMHRVKPHPFTWLVWTLVSAIVLFGQIGKGAGIGALPVAIAEGFTLIIFLFSLQYGFQYVKRSDIYFFIAALLGIIPWLIFHDPTASVVIAVAIDLIAFVPTLRKTYEQPDTETPILYGSNVLRHILTLFSLQTYNIATTLHSVAMIITNSLMIGFITNKKRRR
jgi:asparagine N-glycosylation enzyme membrane subunit Stt3